MIEDQCGFALLTTVQPEVAGVDADVVPAIDGQSVTPRTRERTIQYANIHLNPTTQDIVIDGKTLWLSQLETRILALLMLQANQTVSKQVMTKQIFNDDRDIEPSAIDLYIRRLRKRLKLHGARTMILTIRGVGYLISELAYTPSALP